MKKYIIAEITDNGAKILLSFTDIGQLKEFLLKSQENDSQSKSQVSNYSNGIKAQRQIKESLFGEDSKAQRLGQTHHNPGHREPNGPW